MKKIISATSFVLMFILASSTASANYQINHSDITNQRSCFSGHFASYESWLAMITKSNKRTAKTEEELQVRLQKFKDIFSQANFARYQASVDCIIFKYKVDNIMVDGYFIQPKGKQDLPILIYNRGGNGRYGAVNFASMMRTLFPLTDENFAIIGSQYRGAFNKVVKGQYDEFGGVDVNDVVKLAELIPNIESVNPQKIGMFGSSRGGMQTFLTLKRLTNIKAVAVIAGASDLLKELAFRPAMENVYKKRIPNYEENKEAELSKRSVLHWLDSIDITIPILIQHGDQDKNVSVDNALWLSNGLKKRSHPHQLSIYPGEGHSFKTNAKVKALSELSNWFKKHL